jgi:hypothetical protein
VTLEDAVEQRQRDDPEIMEAVGGRIGWGRELAGEPAITNQIITDERPQHMKGFQRFRSTTIQVDVWGRDPKVVRGIRERLIAVLAPAARVDDGATGVVRFQRAMIANARGSPEQQQGQTAQRSRTDMFRESIDFIFNHDA